MPNHIPSLFLELATDLPNVAFRFVFRILIQSNWYAFLYSFSATLLKPKRADVISDFSGFSSAIDRVKLFLPSIKAANEGLIRQEDSIISLNEESSEPSSDDINIQDLTGEESGTDESVNIEDFDDDDEQNNDSEDDIDVESVTRDKYSKASSTVVMEIGVGLFDVLDGAKQ